MGTPNTAQKHKIQLAQKLDDAPRLPTKKSSTYARNARWIHNSMWNMRVMNDEILWNHSALHVPPNAATL